MSDITSLRLLRGTKAKNDAYTGAEGELTVDTDSVSLRVHDGLTPGGFYLDNGQRYGFGVKEGMGERHMAFPEGLGKENDLYISSFAGVYKLDGSNAVNGPADEGFPPLPQHTYTLEAAWGTTRPDSESDLPYSGTGDTYTDTSNVAWYANNRSVLLFGVGPDGSGGERPFLYHYGENFARRSKWAMYYNNENIVGSVVIDNGSPKGAIFEYGENSNGRYQKRADGKVVCFKRLTLNVTSSDITGGTYSGLVDLGNVTLPASLAVADNFRITIQVPYKPNVVTKSHRVGSSQTVWSQVKFELENSADLAAGDDIIVDLVAEGRV